MTPSQKKTAQRKSTTDARAVPLVMPCSGATAGSDFETAVEVVRRDGKIQKLWQGEPRKQDVPRTSS